MFGITQLCEFVHLQLFAINIAKLKINKCRHYYYYSFYVECITNFEVAIAICFRSSEFTTLTHIKYFLQTSIHINVELTTHISLSNKNDRSVTSSSSCVACTTRGA